MMSSPKSFEKELKQLNETAYINNLRAQECYLQKDYTQCLKHLIHYFLSALNAKLKDKQNENDKNLVEQLESSVNEENLVKLNQAVNSSLTSTNLASSLLTNNEYFLNLLSKNQSLIDWIESLLNQDDLSVSTINHIIAIYLNNLAMIHFSVQKYNLSSLYFQKSLDQNEKFIKNCLLTNNESFKNSEDDDSNKKEEGTTNTNEEDQNESYRNKLLKNKRYDLVYNLGISLLFSKQPISAFDCLYKVAYIYSQNSRLWLRLAECCVMVYRHSLCNENAYDYIPSNITTSGNEKIAKLTEKIKCIANSFGHLHHHKIQVGACLTNESFQSLGYSNFLSLNDMNKLINEKEENNENKEVFNKMITLDFAYMCLKNALNLLPSNQKIFSTKSKSSNSESSSMLSQIKSQLNEEESAAENKDKNEDSAIAASNNPTDIENEQDQANDELLPNRFSNQLNINKHQNQLDNKLFNCVWPSKPINLIELQNLRSSILVSLGYVSLCLKDYVNTIKYCKMLLDQEDPLNLKCPVSKGNKYANFVFLINLLRFI
jgi:hypothetical protein